MTISWGGNFCLNISIPARDIITNNTARRILDEKVDFDTNTTRTDKEGLQPCTAAVLVSLKIYFFSLLYCLQCFFFCLFVCFFFRVIVDLTLAALPLAVRCCFEFYFFVIDANLDMARFVLTDQ